MNIKSVSSVTQDLELNVKELQVQLNDFEAKLVIFFASSYFEPEKVSALMDKAFPEATVFGCSTSGEITSGDMLENSIVAMAFNEKAIGGVAVEVVENLKEDDGSGVEGAFSSFEKHYDISMKEADYKEYVGITLFEMSALSEEKTMDKIGDLTNVVFIGATAGDDTRFVQTYVYANGKAYKNAVILVLLKPNTAFDFIKTQSAVSLNKTLTATKVDETNRQVIEFDGKPALERYAEIVEVDIEHAQEAFITNPLGLIGGGDEIFIRSPFTITDGTKINFICTLLEGMEVTVLETQNIVDDTKKDVEKKISELGHVSGIIDFQCILRALELRNKNQTKAYGEIFSNIPTIGFSTYGEQFIGQINQTSTMLFFK